MASVRSSESNRFVLVLQNTLGLLEGLFSSLESLKVAVTQLIWQRERGMVEAQTDPKLHDLERVLRPLADQFPPVKRSLIKGSSSSNVPQGFYCHMEGS